MNRTDELMALLKRLIDDLSYPEADQLNYRLRDWISVSDEFYELREYLKQHMEATRVAEGILR